MKILVDADACPVKDIILRVAMERKLPVLMFTDTSHAIDDGYSQVIVVDIGRDSVDIALINNACENDIVITGDYGVAAMALAKGAVPVSHNGFVMKSENIERLLFERFISQKIRRAGGRASNPHKRKGRDNLEFESTFRRLCSELN